MVHEKPVSYGPFGRDVDGTRGEKRRRECLPRSSSSSSSSDDDAPTGYEYQISEFLGEHEEEIKKLFGPEVILSEEDQATFVKLLPPDISLYKSMAEMSWMDNDALKQRHGRFRIAYYKVLQQESRHLLKNLGTYYEDESGHQLKDLDAYSEDEICDKNYFKHLENEECFEWFFHPDDDWNPYLDDYQRIVLKSFLPGGMEILYPDVDGYHERYHTYEMDAVYVKCHGELSKRIEWIQAYLHLDEKSADWTEVFIQGWRQALRVATRLPDMTLGLARLAYKEYISELREDASLKDLDVVYFLIWRFVVKDKRRYMDAVKEVYDMDEFHIHKRAMDVELRKAPAFLTMRQQILLITRRVGISVDTEEDEARILFREGLVHVKRKYMVNYAEKKLEIAKVLNWHKRTDLASRTD
ncbi:unnamed protein product [Alopecurus aequalis]